MATYWKEFFSDVNVRFPEKPRLLEGIAVYEAPYGMGVQFKGGPQPLVIRGKKAAHLFNYLKPRLDGSKNWEDILEEAGQQFQTSEVAAVLRILHANSLLRNGGAEHIQQAAHYSVSPEQIKFYERLTGKTGFKKSGEEIAGVISQTKCLVIGSGNLLPLMLEQMKRSGFQHTGCCTVDGEARLKEQLAEQEDLMSYQDLENQPIERIEQYLYDIIDDYQYLIVAISNPSTDFLHKINRIGINSNKPIFYFSKKVDGYEIGPYVVPRRSACYFCNTLRKNSYEDDALFENIYQDHIRAKAQLSDQAIQGEDYVSKLTAIGFLISEVIKAVTGYASPALLNQSLRYDSVNGKFTHQSVMRVPGCPECA
ncbi:MAG: hypothetical protein AAFP19_20235 [Bacteroidota bacterium]